MHAFQKASCSCRPQITSVNTSESAPLAATHGQAVPQCCTHDWGVQSIMNSPFLSPHFPLQYRWILTWPVQKTVPNHFYVLFRQPLNSGLPFSVSRLTSGLQLVVNFLRSCWCGLLLMIVFDTSAPTVHPEMYSRRWCGLLLMIVFDTSAPTVHPEMYSRRWCGLLLTRS